MSDKEIELYELYWHGDHTISILDGVASHLKARQLAVAVVNVRGGWVEIWHKRRLVGVVEKGNVV